MRKILYVLISVLLLSGCATSYAVRFNGYLDGQNREKSRIGRSAAFCVAEGNKNAKNPILEAEVKSKIERLLQQNGYAVVPCETADFYLSFMYTISSGRNIPELMPIYHPPETGTIRTVDRDGESSTSIVTFPGYTSFVPHKTTVYSSSLILEIFDGQPLRTSDQQRPLWIGEASATSQNADLREMIDYLLLASFTHFAKDTKKAITMEISGNKP